MSPFSACRLRAVSLSVSPLVRLEVVTEILITSALNRSAASSKDVRVRVLGSTKKFTNVFPRSDGTFLISRVPTCLNASVVSRMKLISSAESSRRPSKSFRVQRVVIVPLPAIPHPVSHRFLEAGRSPFRYLRSANSFRRNRGGSAARDGRGRLVLRAESETAVPMRRWRPGRRAQCGPCKERHPQQRRCAPPVVEGVSIP